MCLCVCGRALALASSGFFKRDSMIGFGYSVLSPCLFSTGFKLCISNPVSWFDVL